VSKYKKDRNDKDGVNQDYLKKRVPEEIEAYRKGESQHETETI